MRWALFVALGLSTLSSGAELTRVASSFEPNDPFGMFLDFAFFHTHEEAVITREWYQSTGAENQTIDELKYAHYQTGLGVDIHLGLFRDLELHVGVPIIFQDDRAWDFASGTTAATTSIYQTCGTARGGDCTTPGAGKGQLFAVPATSYRSGLGDFTFGLAYAPYVQKKDPSKPTWVLRFEYTAPTAALLDPYVRTFNSSRGGIGEKVHKYQFSTAVSKRLGIAEPYAQLHYTLPWRGPGYYSNCDHATNASLSYPENCGQTGWSRADTGITPQHFGGLDFGTELTIFERPDRFQRVAIDFRGSFKYFSQGRVYNEVSDLFGKLLQTTDYGQLAGQFGFVGQAAEFIILRASASFAYTTEHFLTNETIGKDLDGNGYVDVTVNPKEVNPNFDFRVDQPGRRFRVERQFTFTVNVTATFNF